MSFRPEPAHRHGSPSRTAVLLVNLGTPDEPTAPALRRYLAEFLSDPRVVEIPRLLWLAILHGIILRVRPAKSAAKYRSIWLPEGSPLAVWTERQARALGQELTGRGHHVEVRPAMRYGRPALAQVMDELRAAGATRVLVLPLYPQYASATTGSVADALHRWALRARWCPNCAASASTTTMRATSTPLRHGCATTGSSRPRPSVWCSAFMACPNAACTWATPITASATRLPGLLRERLGLAPEQVLVTFQSRFGKARWLQPYTEPTLRELAGAGVRSVDVMCPGFVADCLETLEEIAQEARDAFVESGGQDFRYVPCLNDEPQWIAALGNLAERHLQGWQTRSPPQHDEAQRQRALALGARD